MTHLGYHHDPSLSDNFLVSDKNVQGSRKDLQTTTN